MRSFTRTVVVAWLTLGSSQGQAQVPEPLPPQQDPTPLMAPSLPETPVTPVYPPVVYPWPPAPYPRAFARPAPYQPWLRPRRVRGTVGFAGFGTIVAGQDGGLETIFNGSGFSVWGGVEIGRVIGVEAKYSSSFHDPIRTCFRDFDFVVCDDDYLVIQSFGLNLVLHIPTTTRVVPYFEVGPLVTWMDRQYSVGSASGGGFEAGGGVDVWVTPHVTIGFQSLYRGLVTGDFGHVRSTGMYLSLVQLGGTLAVHFW